MTTEPLDLDAIQARATDENLTPGPWTLDRESCDCSDGYCSHGAYVTGVVTPVPTEIAAERLKRTGEQPRDYDFHRSEVGDFTEADWELMVAAREAMPALVAEVRRLRADAAAELLPAWEAVYEPGNVSDYLIGYANSDAAAKGAAEAWLRSQKDEPGRLEWVPDEQLATGEYDAWFELVEHHDDGIPTGPGLIVRRRAVEETR